MLSKINVFGTTVSTPSVKRMAPPPPGWKPTTPSFDWKPMING